MTTTQQSTNSILPQPARTKMRPVERIEGRKPMAAGYVILVVFVALFIGTVLNAPGLYKTARTQPQGWRRDVAVAVMTPVKWVSVHVGLSLPREFLQEATGQQGADKINTFIPNPGTTAPANALPTTTTTLKPVATPGNKVRVWIAGDSLSVTPGQSFERKADGAVTDLQGLDGRVSTGLARPDVFNWFAHVKSETARLIPQVVFLTFGANDDQYLVGGPGGKSVGPFGSEAWKAEYHRRVGAMMDQVIGEGRRVVWTGIPNVRDSDRAARYAVLNAIYKEEAEARPGRAYYIDSWSLLNDPSGQYSDDLVVDGSPQRARAPDGIHFTRVGGDIIAAAQLRKLGEFWDLVSGRNTPVPAPSTAAKTPVRRK